MKLKIEQVASIILSIISIVLIIDTILLQFFNQGNYQKNLALGYCIAFVILSVKYKNILSKKYVVIPLYVMVLQTIYSLIVNR